MRDTKLFSLFLILIFMPIYSSFAQVLQQNLDQAKKKKWGGFFIATYDNNLKDKVTAMDSSSYNLRGVIDHRIGGGHAVRLVLGLSQQLSGQNQNGSSIQNPSDFNDGVLAWRKAKPLFDGKILVISQARAIIPLSEDSKQNSSLQTSIGYAPTVIFDLGELAHPGINGSSLIYVPSVSQNFHKYKTALDGSSNSERTFSQSLTAEYAPNDKLFFNLGGTYIMGWTYAGTRKNDQFDTYESISYQVSAKTNVGIGHSNGGPIYRANGYSNNVKFYNKNTSSYYIQVFHTF